MLRVLIAVFSTILCSLPVSVYGFEWPNFNLELSYAGDDNINKAQSEIDISEDTIFDIRGSAVYFKELNPRHALAYSLFFSTEEYSLFKGLEKTSFGFKTTWNFLTRTGFTAPVYQISIAIEDADYETDIRDRFITTLEGNISLHLTDRITSVYGLTYRKSKADNSPVFDLKESRIFANFDYLINDQYTFYTTYSFIKGDLVSTATPTLAILNWAEELVPDNAFGGLSTSATAYKLEADSQVLNLGLNVALGKQHSIDGSFMLISSDASGSNEYDRVISRLSYLTRF